MLMLKYGNAQKNNTVPHLSFLYPYQLKKGLRLEHAVIPVFQILMEAKNKSGVLRQISSMLLILFYFFPHCSAFLLHTILYGLTGSCSSFVPHYAVVLREPLRLFSFVFRGNQSLCSLLGSSCSKTFGFRVTRRNTALQVSFILRCCNAVVTNLKD